MLIIGCGNLLRGDDGVGVHVVRELEKLSLPGKVKIIDAGTRSLDMLFQMEAEDKVVIIDAVKGGLEAGTIYRLTKEDLSSPEATPISLHEVKLEYALRMGDRIWGERSPREIVIFGVEAASLIQGIGLSPKVEECLPKLVNLILEEL